MFFPFSIGSTCIMTFKRGLYMLNVIEYVIEYLKFEWNDEWLLLIKLYTVFVSYFLLFYKEI